MTPIRVPPLGESIVEATISRWLKEEGEPVASGETLVELETDKVTVEVPAAKAGVLVRRLFKAGDVVKVDQVLAEVDESQAPAVASSTPASAVSFTDSGESLPSADFCDGVAGSSIRV